MNYWLGWSETSPFKAQVHISSTSASFKQPSQHSLSYAFKSCTIVGVLYPGRTWSWGWGLWGRFLSYVPALCSTCTSFTSAAQQGLYCHVDPLHPDPWSHACWICSRVLSVLTYHNTTTFRQTTRTYAHDTTNWSSRHPCSPSGNYCMFY